MSNIIPFDTASGNLPAYLKQAKREGINDDLTAHAGAGFPVMSIKGKNFSVIRDGERTVLTKEVDGEMIAVPSIEVVMVKANKGTSKVFYIKGYQEGAEAVKPDCFSNTGDKPDASVAEPQAKSCAVCPHNQWGSKVSDNGSKGKACQDSVRMAIATPDLINDPYLLRVPPASIKSLGEYGKMLGKRGVGYNMVVTRIGFDMESPTPKLTFKPTGLLSDTAYAQVQEVIASDVVQSILGTEGMAVAQAEAQAEAEPEQDLPVVEVKKAEPVAEKAAAKPKAAKAAEPKPAPVDTTVDVGGLNLDDLNFDD
jgi:hypothetical protein